MLSGRFCAVGEGFALRAERAMSAGLVSRQVRCYVHSGSADVEGGGGFAT